MRHSFETSIAAIVIAGAGLASACDINFFLCEPADEAVIERLPTRLSETGLYADIGSDQIADDVVLYRPEFELWADGAGKRRWIRLPAGTAIDTSRMDDWQFPIGTRLWKEFSIDGVAIETRLIERLGPGNGDWAAISYVWNDRGDDANIAPHGFFEAGGTNHNVPAASECVGCHGGRESYVLGFSAIQLSHELPGPEASLGDFVAAGALSAPPTEPLEIPGNATERGALGYLHANCGHCHNRSRPERDRARCYDPKNILDFWLVVDGLGSPDVTTTYQTAIGFKITPGDPGDSRVVDRMDRRDFIYQMPPLGTDVVDAEAVELITRWVREL